MHRQILRISCSALIVLVLTMVGANSSAYAIWGHGTSYGPTFGGGTFSYKDGLKINRATYDISNYIQATSTNTLYVDAPSAITLKLWDNSGSYAIQGVALFLNVRGYNPDAASSDSWIVYSKSTGVTTHDPHNILGPVKVDVKYDKYFMYVTFHMTPKSPMNTSWLIAQAWDFRLAVGTAKVIDAINISYVPFAYH